MCLNELARLAGYGDRLCRGARVRQASVHLHSNRPALRPPEEPIVTQNASLSGARTDPVPLPFHTTNEKTQLPNWQLRLNRFLLLHLWQ